MDLPYSLFDLFFSELFIIPYSILLDIHYSFSSLSSNFGCTDVATPSTLYSRLASPTQCSPKIDPSMFTVETVVSQTKLFFSVMRKIKVLNARRIALILRVIYGIDDNTAGLINVCSVNLKGLGHAILGNFV